MAEAAEGGSAKTGARSDTQPSPRRSCGAPAAGEMRAVAEHEDHRRRQQREQQGHQQRGLPAQPGIEHAHQCGAAPCQGQHADQPGQRRPACCGASSPPASSPADQHHLRRRRPDRKAPRVHAPCAKRKASVSHCPDGPAPDGGECGLTPEKAVRPVPQSENPRCRPDRRPSWTAISRPMSAGHRQRPGAQEIFRRRRSRRTTARLPKSWKRGRRRAEGRAPRRAAGTGCRFAQAGIPRQHATGCTGSAPAAMQPRGPSPEPGLTVRHPAPPARSQPGTSLPIRRPASLPACACHHLVTPALRRSTSRVYLLLGYRNVPRPRSSLPQACAPHSTSPDCSRTAAGGRTPASPPYQRRGSERCSIHHSGDSPASANSADPGYAGHAGRRQAVTGEFSSAPGERPSRNTTSPS